MKFLLKLAVLLASVAACCPAQTTQPTSQQVDASFDALAQQLPKLKAAYDAAVAYQPVAIVATLPTTRPAPFLGMNDGANDPWEYCRWADATRSATAWQDTSNGTLPVTFNAKKYPVGQNIRVQSTTWCLGCPAGDYQLIWSGNATVTASVYGGSYKATGPNSGVVTLPQPCTWIQNQWGWNPSEIVTIVVTSSDPNNPLDKLRLWLPGYGPGTSHGEQLYRDEDLEMCRHFAAIRCMNSQRTSNLTLSAGAWASRTTMDQWDWTSAGLAIPIEADIERCQKSGVRTLWFSTPTGADDAWLRACAQLIHDRFHGTLIVEPPDELWNGPNSGFVGANYIDNLANHTAIGMYDGNVTNGKWVPTPAGQPYVTDGYTRRARAGADYAAHIAKIFKAVYTDRPGDCQPTFGGCSADPRWITLGMQFLVARDGTHPFSSFCIAPYAIDPWAAGGKYYTQAGTTPTLADLFNSCSAYMADTNQPGVLWQLAQHSALAKQYGVQLLGYEGGQTWYPQDNPYTGKDLSTQAQTDPRMGQLYDQMFTSLHQYNFAMFCDFLPIAEPWKSSGFWADLNGGYADIPNNPPRWAAVMREAAKSN